MGTIFTDNLTAQANAIRRMAEGDDVHPVTKDVLLGALATVEAVKRQRDRKKADAETNILALPDNATTSEIRHNRKRQSVRQGADVYLPSWELGTFALPNSLIRSGLFAAAETLIETTDERKVGTQGATAIKLAGCLLGYDSHVFAALLTLAKSSPLAEAHSPWIQVSFWQFSQAMAVPYGVRVQAAIRKSLIRLNSARIRIRVNKLDIKLSQLVEVELKKVAKRKSSGSSETAEPIAGESIAFRIPQPVAELFGYAAWTKVPSAALTRYSGLVRWLATYYSSHAKSYPVAIDDMHGFTGSTCSLAEFRRRLKVALKKLQTADTPDELRVEDFVLATVNGVLTITVYLSSWNEQRTMSPEGMEFAELD
jgi:hypothetical protein